ncbi:unnamed protein product [Caenorhabditis brenneri]
MDSFPENSTQFRVLYLTGPTGSGKSTAVEVLCKEKKIELIDYSPELLHDDRLECEKPNCSQLIRFLIRRHRSLNAKPSKCVLFISELPDQAYSESEAFRDDISEALRFIRHPVIFCLTNNIASWNLNPDRIFTSEFIKKNHIDTINFNPVADTLMKKAMGRASRLLRSSLSETKLKMIGETANGDLRIAMNMIQMNSAGPDVSRRPGSKIIFASKANREDAFHMIGRILYAKRVNPNIPQPKGHFIKKRKSAPAPEPTERTDLEHDPTEIISMSSMSSEKLTGFLFENEHAFCSDIKKYRQVIEALSFCDVLTGDWSSARTFPDEYASQVATRSVMWHNFNEIRPKTLYAISPFAMKNLERQMTITRNDVRRLPMVGDKHFSSLTAPYQTIIENIIDPRRIEMFISRPMDLSWNKGKDRIEEQMVNLQTLSFLGRKKPQMKKKNVVQVNSYNCKGKTDEESEEEKFTIEDSSDDSFDSFDEN